ncbi:secreted protein [Algoriphagus boseongensis]|uniref:Secreted protein n=1 Tax=Algoriphagus boseongensis TaxID=1442587 RepID=A0A4R6TB96_9BACT|nr:TIM barrel protein [Algoriphagus boseongensis]TDQ19513.1 secreted protein [Algoriphagus boseongensis]
MIAKDLSRRDFIQKSLAAGLGLAAFPSIAGLASQAEPKMKFGLVTYEWAKDWDLPTLISNCEKTRILGVELRTQHAHGVEISLSKTQREEVKKRFADSPVTCLGYGSNYEYHSPDPEKLKQNIEGTKAYIELCHDIGATGIKVKPNFLPPDVPKEKTITQIAASFNEVGKYAQDFGQLIRVEVHGQYTQELPVMKAIFEQVTESNVKICWNCNEEDLLPPGLEANFNSVKQWFGDTVHVREFNVGTYPYQDLFRLFNQMNYEGWILMEARTQPTDRILALREQKEIFQQLTTASTSL